VVGPVPASWEIDPQLAGARLVVPGVWRLRLPTAWDGIDHANAWAVEAEDDGIVLFDCGSAGHPSYEEALERALEQAGHTIEDVRLLIATHVHSDHIGLAKLVIERAGAELWAHPDDAHFYDGTREPERIAAARTRRAIAEGVPASRLDALCNTREETEGVLAAVAPHRELRTGVTVPSALGPWEVFETPGHCPSHVCLVQREHGLAVVGDLICAAFVPWLDYGYSPDPYAETIASLDLLAGIPGLRLALPGHGRPIDDVYGVTKMTRDGMVERLAACRKAIARGPAGAFELSERMLGPQPDSIEVSHLAEVMAYLRHLMLRGEVVRDVDADGRHRYRLTEAGIAARNGGDA
jgi:glyoxylase-like metal-dependent hydrolase (beta-lactamase superfamily II)